MTYEYLHIMNPRSDLTTDGLGYGERSLVQTSSGHLSAPSLGGFQRGVFVRGANLNHRGRWRAPVAIINFAFFVREILVESNTNSEIFTGI